MADIDIKNDNTDKITEELKKATRTALTAVGMQAVSDIISQGDFPVDTGLLRNSITFALSGEGAHIGTYTATRAKAVGDKMVLEKGSYSGMMPDETPAKVYIGTNVEYAKYVQYGTSRMRGRDFMIAPLRANLGHYKDILDKYLKQG